MVNRKYRIKMAVLFMGGMAFASIPLKAAVFPSTLPVSSTFTDYKALTLVITNDILKSGGVTNAGLNYIKLTKPSEFSWPSTINLTNNHPSNYCIRIRDYYDNNVSIRTLVNNKWWTNLTSFFSAPNRAMIRTNGNDVYIILSSQITNMSVAARENIFIDMRFKVTNFTTVQFDSYVQAMRFRDMTSRTSNYSTCGWQKTTGTASVSIEEGAAFAYASVTPAQIFQGPNDYAFTYRFSTTGVSGRQDVLWAAIKVPSGFSNCQITNLDSVLMGTNEKALIKVTNIAALGTGRFIRLNYTTSTLVSPGGLDVITFNVKGSVIKGNWKWASYVDNSALSGSSLPTGTNATYPSQWCVVNGETPKADGQITIPIGKVLFNNISLNTMEYEIRNTSANADNRIYDAIIAVPDIFTNVRKLSSLRISTNYMKVGKIGNISYVTLHYGLGGGYIPYNNAVDRVKFLTIHKIGVGKATNALFSAVVNNSNGEGFKNITAASAVNTISITDPQPVGTASIIPLDGVVYTSDTTNQYRYRVKNVAPGGSIYYARITFPTAYFTNVLSVYSSTISNAYISIVNRTNVFLNYRNASNDSRCGKNALGVGEFDDVYLLVKDRYTNIAVPSSSIVRCTVSNLTIKNSASDLNPPDETRTVAFVPQEARVQSYVSNNYIRTEVTSSTLYCVIYNYGEAGNRVEDALLEFSAGSVTITSATSLWAGPWDILTFTRVQKTNYRLPAGQSDIVRLVLTDTITAEETRDLLASVTVNTSVMKAASIPSGKTNRVFFQTPPPSAGGKLFPNAMFTVPSGSRTNHFLFTVYNNGDGSNELEEAVIYIPAGLTGKVKGRNSSWLGGSAFITNKSDRVIVAYAAAASTLDAKATDVITLEVTNTYTKKTNFFWKLGVANNDLKGIYTNTYTLSGGSKNLDIVKQPDAYIASPAYIEDSSVTNQIIYKLINTNASSKKIIRMKITLPVSVYGILTNTLTAVWPGSARSVSNDFIWIDYSGNNLIAGAEETVSFKVTDSVNKTTNTTLWSSFIQYYTNGQFYGTGTNMGSQSLKIQLVPPSARAALSRNYLYTTSVTNTLNLFITNKGVGANDITKARIYYSPNISIAAGHVQSSRISNDSQYITNYAGYFTIHYRNDNHLLKAGTADTVTIKMSDLITNITAVTLRCEVNNTDPVVETYSAAGGSTVLNTVYPLNAYITPSTVDVTTYTNYYIYRLNNIGGNRPVSRAVIFFPGIISAIVSNGSSWIANDGANIDLSGSTSMTLNYSADGSGALPTTGFDEVTFKGVDSRDLWSTNVTYRCWMDDGTGYVDTITTIGQTKTVSYGMPEVSAKGILITQGIYLSTNIAKRTIQYKITNTGAYANSIHQAQIKVPHIFSNCVVTNMASTILGAANMSVSNQGTNRYVVLHYEDGTLLGSGRADTVTFSLTNFLIPVEIFGIPFGCLVRNAPLPATNRRVDTGVLLNISDPNPYRADAYLAGGSQVIYTLNTTASLTYRIDNNSSKSNIDLAVIRFDGTLFTNLEVKSRLCASNSITKGATNITLDYAPGVFTKVGGGGQNYYDIITLKFGYRVSAATSRTLSCRVTYEGGVEISATEGIETQVLSVEKSYWGRITGIIRPNLETAVSLYNAGTSVRKANFNGTSTFFSTSLSSNTSGFVLDLIPPGSYDLECQRTGYKTDRYRISIVVYSNQVTDAGTITLKNALLEAKALTTRTNFCPDDPYSYAVFPAGSVLADFYMDIAKTAADASQTGAVSKCASILGLPNAASLKVYLFDLFDASENAMTENEIGTSITIVLHYTDQEIADQGWSEDSLAIYYYKENTKDWVRLGGAVDAAKNTVTLKVNYLHKTYAVFGASAVTYNKIYGDLKCWPNPFSPGRGGDTYGNMKISFMFQQQVTGFSFSVFDLAGRKVYSREYAGEYTQGEIYWDGRDNEKYTVKSGVYIFQIEAAGQRYRSKVLILK